MADFGFWTLVADFGFRTLVAHNTTSSSLHCYKNCAKSVATCFNSLFFVLSRNKDETHPSIFPVWPPSWTWPTG